MEIPMDLLIKIMWLTVTVRIITVLMEIPVVDRDGNRNGDEDDFNEVCLTSICYKTYI